jgi:membrane-associated phospholipid phosphatase
VKKETYLKIFQRVQSVPNGALFLKWMGKVLTYVTALVYFAAVLGGVSGGRWKQTALLVCVPAVSFVAVSVFRSCFHAKRPYEVYDFAPLIEKETKEKSFPSRHVFSIFVIGSTMVWFYPVAGILIGLMGCVLAVVRVVAGVHFPKDVLAGAVIGILCGCLTGIFL